MHYKIIVKRLQKLEVEETPRYTQHYNTGTERSVCAETQKHDWPSPEDKSSQGTSS